MRKSFQKRLNRAQRALCSSAQPAALLGARVRAHAPVVYPSARSRLSSERERAALCVFIVVAAAVVIAPFCATHKTDRVKRAGRYDEHEPHHRSGVPRRTLPSPLNARAARDGPPLKRELQRCPAERGGSWRRRTLSWRTSSGARTVRSAFNFSLIYLFI